jgi:hypothetical protein
MSSETILACVAVLLHLHQEDHDRVALNWSYSHDPKISVEWRAGSSL